MAFLTSKELNALEKHVRDLQERDPDTAWVITTEDRIRLVGNNVVLAHKFIPKYEMSIKQVTLPSSNAELEIVEVKGMFLGKFLAGILFTDNKKVEIFKFEGNSYVQTAAATPGEYGQVQDLICDDDIGSELPRPVVNLFREKVKGQGHRQAGIGLFVINKVSRTVSLCSFQDNKELDILDGVLQSISPSECVIQEDVQDKEAIIKILKYQNVTVDERSGHEKVGSLDKVMANLENVVDFTTCDLGMLEKDEKLALMAAGIAMPTISEDKYKIVRINVNEFMKLSLSTMEGIHVFGSTSLFSTLNHTRTSGGERMLKSWIRQPLRSANSIQARLDLVEKFLDAQNCRKSLHNGCLRKMPDIERVCQKFDMNRVNLVDLFKLYAGLGETAKIKGILCEEFGNDGIVYDTFGQHFEEVLKNINKYKNMVEKTLDFDALENCEYRINPGFDDKLTEMKEEQDEIRRKIEKNSDKERDRLGMNSKTMKLEHNSIHGFFFRVTLKDEKGLRQKKGLNFFDSAKSGVKFRSNELDSLNDRYTELSKKYELHQQYIIEEVVQISQGYCKHFIDMSAKVSELDCIVSLAVAAEVAPIPYVKPMLNENRVIDMRKARHPVLEQKGCLNYIPNDVLISREGGNFLIITGPNLGGKSTYMRSVGLCVLMAQIGSFVPCQEANICPVDSILVRIGASDSQFYGVSTFMSEMLDASRILRHATENSLIIIDEIGRGTSTYDGFGLAWAISHHIASEIKAPTLFATHFHEMTKLSDELPNVKNLFCDAVVEENQLTLLYNVAPGICQNSFGIEVAQMAGFPDDILSDARKFLKEMEIGSDGNLLKESESMDLS